jgi:hypothetical protein
MGSCVMGCGASGKKQALDVALDNRQQRQETFEATLRELDEHPEYVDELFKLALEHPYTLDRFLRNAALHMHDRKLAELTAKHLVGNPEGLELVLVRTLDALHGNAPAKRAAAEAMRQRAGVSADVLASHPEALHANVVALTEAVVGRPPARKAFLQAMSEKSPELAQLLIANPGVLERVMKAIISAGFQQDRSKMLALLKELADPDPG